jgi:ParB family chromosome partitioning protein
MTTATGTTLRIDEITIHERSRCEMRNIGALAASIEAVGLLNPPTVRRTGDEWVLVAGERRLAAMDQLGWTTTPVTVATSIEDELTALYAERDENTQREDFSPSEMVVHARRIEHLEQDLAVQRRQQGGERGRASRYGLASAESAGASEPPHERQARHRVAKAVGTSHDTLSKARHVIDTAEDPDTPPEVAEVAKQAAANLSQPGAVVDREHRAVREAEQVHAERTVVDAIEKRVPGAKAEIARKLLRARWAKAMAGMADIPLMDPIAVVSVLSDTEISAYRGVQVEVNKWFTRFDAAKAPGLRVVGGNNE